MPNINGAFGLRPLNRLGSGYSTLGLTEYRIDPANTNAIYQGAPVIPLSTGLIDRVGAANGGTVSLLGAFWGCEYVSSSTGEKVYSKHWPGSGASTSYPVKAFVYDDPMQLFLIAADATVTNEATARSHVFANANFSDAQTGVASTGLSSARLAVSTIATTAALQLRIVGIQESADNSDFAAAGIGFIVRLNNHFNAPNGSIAAGTVSTTGV